MKTFQDFLDIHEADARRLQAQRAGMAGKGAYDAGMDIAQGVAAVASGNVLAMFKLLKDAFDAYKAVTETTTAASMLVESQRLHMKLHDHIAKTINKETADAYVSVVFDVDAKIIPMIPPDSWNDIMSEFVSNLKGNMSDFKSLTFAHAIASQFGKHLGEVNSVIEGQADQWGVKLAKLEAKQQASPLKSFAAKQQPERRSQSLNDKLDRATEQEHQQVAVLIDKAVEKIRKSFDSGTEYKNKYPGGMIRFIDGLQSWWNRHKIWNNERGRYDVDEPASVYHKDDRLMNARDNVGIWGGIKKSFVGKHSAKDLFYGAVKQYEILCKVAPGTYSQYL